MLHITTTAARNCAFCIFTSLTACRTTDAFNTFFLLSYKIYYNCNNYKSNYCNHYIIAYTHKHHLYLTAAFSATFKAYSAFNFLFVLIISAITIPAIQSTATRPIIAATTLSEAGAYCINKVSNGITYCKLKTNAAPKPFCTLHFSVHSTNSRKTRRSV